MDNNTKEGRVVIPVQLSSGKLMMPIDGFPVRNTFLVHPDSGVQLKDEIIPFWEDSKALAIVTLNKFPMMHFAGLDVAVGADGPVVLELNVKANFSGSAFCNVGLAKFVSE